MGYCHHHKSSQQLSICCYLFGHDDTSQATKLLLQNSFFHPSMQRKAAEHMTHLKLVFDYLIYQSIAKPEERERERGREREKEMEQRR